MGVKIVKPIKTLKLFPPMDAIEKQVGIVAKDALVEIKNRTLSGRDIAGNRFKKYSTNAITIDGKQYAGGYAEYRKEMGRQVTPPNLSFTGQMLGSLMTETTTSGSVVTGSIYPANPDEKAKIIANADLGRSFFGFSSKQISSISKRIKSFVKTYTHSNRG